MSPVTDDPAPATKSLFSQSRPLAARLRPQTVDQIVGQQHLVGEGKPLREAILGDHLHSMVFWGPPGVGKTSLAQVIAQSCDAAFLAVSAVLSGVKEIRNAVEQAKLEQQLGRRTLLFVDEVHRFNKSQQDAFLPYVEDGTVIFVGATTENPSFALNNALMSRCRLYVLKSLTNEDLIALLDSALQRPDGLGERQFQVETGVLDAIAGAADGDARRALNLLEVAADLAEERDGQAWLTMSSLELLTAGSTRRFDRGGDDFYEQISALHKAVRGSSVDGALYWFCRMVDGGCDLQYLSRRLIRMASEDIGNADPRGLSIAMDAAAAYERLGSPEGELSLAQAVVYLASAPKSNAVYKAFKEAMATVKSQPSHPVPLHLRNAPTRVMKSLDYGREYRYAHDEPGAYAAGENYLPEAIHDSRFYDPVDRGLERKIAEKLEHLRSLDANSSWQRYKK